MHVWKQNHSYIILVNDAFLTIGKVLSHYYLVTTLEL